MVISSMIIGLEESDSVRTSSLDTFYEIVRGGEAGADLRTMDDNVCYTWSAPFFVKNAYFVRCRPDNRMFRTKKWQYVL